MEAAIKAAQQASRNARAELLQKLNLADTSGSDVRTFKTSEGATLRTDALLFLTFKASSNGKTFTKDVMVLDAVNIRGALGRAKATENLFTKYGRAKGKELSINPHALRHALTTELFRLHVPDTLITSYFGRQTVAQSYEYDHRNRFELLDAVELPPDAAGVIEPGSPQELVSKMVVAGVAGKSHIAESFRKVQREQGDRAAFEYLAASASGFHTTPYGFCVNSFSIDPCARHLKCFDQCSHFMPSGRVEHKVSLESLRQNLRQMRSRAEASPGTSLGRKNQIAHADRLLSGVERALETQPGMHVFPEGTDHSEPPKDLFE